MNNKLNSKLFHRDFTIMIVGQIISLFGNAILRFSLSLHVLDLTGSAAVFGTVLALSMIPTVVLSPFGGVLADRLPKQRIMTVLDFLTAGMILLFDWCFAGSGSLTAIAVFLILLTLIQAFYQPSVQASIPVLTVSEQLMAANGVVAQVQALASLLGPVIAGILYSFTGIGPILAVSAVCFFLSAVMELFLHIPYEKRTAAVSPWKMALKDLGEALHYLMTENPRIMKLLVIVAGINLFFSAVFIIGLPFLVKIYLGYSAEMYGFAEAALGLGSILGGVISGVAGKKIKFRSSYLFMAGSVAALLPVAAALAFRAPEPAVYVILLFSTLAGMAFSTVFSITAQTFIQQMTPVHLLGKVGAFISTICVCALPLGQAMYGALFEIFRFDPWMVVVFGCAVSLVLVAVVKKVLKEA